MPCGGGLGEVTEYVEYEGNDVGDFLKEVPHTPQELLWKRKEGSPVQILLSLYGKGSVPFRRYYRELMGPIPFAPRNKILPC
jgi:hypothetical protein